MSICNVKTENIFHHYWYFFNLHNTHKNLLCPMKHLNIVSDLSHRDPTTSAVILLMDLTGVRRMNLIELSCYVLLERILYVSLGEPLRQLFDEWKLLCVFPDYFDTMLISELKAKLKSLVTARSDIETWVFKQIKKFILFLPCASFCRITTIWSTLTPTPYLTSFTGEDAYWGSSRNNETCHNRCRYKLNWLEPIGPISSFDRTWPMHYKLYNVTNKTTDMTCVALQSVRKYTAICRKIILS